MRKKEVLAAIRRRYRDRQPLNVSTVKREDPELVAAVYDVTPYWGWKQALADAGLSYQSIRIEVRETVQCQLCGKSFRSLLGHLRIHETDPEDYRVKYPDAEIVSESMRQASMGPRCKMPAPWLPHWEPIYTPEYVLDRVKEYADQGIWMELSTIERLDASLLRAVRYHLDVSWDDALRWIGLDPVVYRGCYRPDDFSLADLQAFLEQRRAAGLLSTPAALFATYDDRHRRPRVFTWALQRYGNWSAALDAAGVDRSDPLFGGDRYLTKESVIEDLQRLQHELPDMSHTTVSLLPYGIQLTGAATRYYGGWDAALDAADIPVDIRRRMATYDSADEVVAGITHRLENEFSVAPLDVFFGARSDIQLWKAAFRFFSSWRSAVVKSGGTSAQVKQAADTPLGTRAKVLRELRRRSHDVRQLAITSLTSDVADKQLHAMASGFFGDWQSAVRAIGVDPKSYHQWNLTPHRKYADKESLLKEIRRRRRAGEPLHARGLTSGEHVDVPLLYTARKMFGDWESAIRAAGIDYDTIVRKRQDYDAYRDRVYRSYTSADQVTQELKRRHAEGMPLNVRAVTHSKEEEYRDFALFRAAKEYFGSWEAALTDAGIDVESIRPAWVTKRAERLRQKQQRSP
ncbi:hypothetical protein Rcae01_03343 [Novipirellula caenicola]|uniref:C2H2-type domain-containing protein n=2 Tax=Novipirellula caenicola TaxID=1536901 RepID=A0ABP9VRY4_9BACT